MPSNAPAAVIAGASGSVRKPFELIELGYSTPIRLSTGPQVEWDGKVWVSGLAQAPRYRTGAGNILDATVAISNVNTGFGALALAQDGDFVSAKMWALYGPGPHAVGDAHAILDGKVNGIEDIGDALVVLDLSGRASEVLNALRRRYEDFTSLSMPPGTVIAFGGERHSLRIDRG